MKKILIFTRRGHEKWVKSFKDNLILSSFDVILLSEQSVGGDINLGKRISEVMQNINNNSENLISKFSNDDLLDIVVRCRVLRSLDNFEAIKLILSAEIVFNQIYDEYKPDCFISLRVDTYILDVFQRLFKFKGVQYIGLWRSAFLKKHFFITARGEHYGHIRKVPKSQLDFFVGSIGSNNFAATSIQSDSKFIKVKIYKTYIYLFLRDLFFQSLRIIPWMKYGYREMANQFLVKESRTSFLYLSPKIYLKQEYFLSHNIISVKSVFVALQVNPEATIDYYVSDKYFINVQSTLKYLCKVLSDAGYYIYIKDHPNMSGKRNFKHLNDLLSIDNVFFVDSTVDSNILLNKCMFTFTWSGTVAVQSFIKGNISISINCPYFVKSKRFIKLNSFLSLKELPDLMHQAVNCNSSKDEIYELALNILKHTFPGTVYSKTFEDDDISSVVKTLFEAGVI